MKKSIGLLLFPGFQIVDLAAVTVFEVANGMPGGPYYACRCCPSTAARCSVRPACRW
jgi:transcriptional regulator GlxA family with amidase domain